MIHIVIQRNFFIIKANYGNVLFPNLLLPGIKMEICLWSHVEIPPLCFAASLAPLFSLKLYHIFKCVNTIFCLF